MEDPIVPLAKLPNDVIVDILTWLPVKSLLKFRCVSKSWRNLISSQQFVTTHLQNSKLDRHFTANQLILWCDEGNVKQCSVNSMLYEPVYEPFDLSCSVESRIGLVVGSCNGLICLLCLCNFQLALILWNPSTRMRKVLPDSGVKLNLDRRFKYGFGYDKSSDDYKVVGLSDGSEGIMQVYSLRNDRWKRINNFLKGKSEMDNPASFVNGKLYWIDHDDDDLFWYIVSFDLEKEEDEMMQLPSNVKNCDYAMLGASEGSLLVMCSHPTSIDVWIMDGRSSVGDEKWTKIVTTPYVDDTLEYHKFAMYVKNGQLLFLLFALPKCTFVKVDAKDWSISYHEVRNLGSYFEIGVYLESLVSPLE